MKNEDEHENETGCSLASIKTGLLHLFLQHTSAALSLNENWDEDVRRDMSDALEGIVKEDVVSLFFALFLFLVFPSMAWFAFLPAHLPTTLTSLSLSLFLFIGRGRVVFMIIDEGNGINPF